MCNSCLDAMRGLEVSLWGSRVQVGPLEVCDGVGGGILLALMSFSQIVHVAPKFRVPGLIEVGI